MEANLNEIIQKLEAFIKKYLMFKILRGFYLTIGLIITIFLFESVIEYFNYFPVTTKTILLAFSFVLFLILIVYYLLLPALSLVKLRKRLSYSEAASIVSHHFPQIKDKLLNTLELGSLIGSSPFEASLIIASINQRTMELRPFSFQYAVSFNNIKKYFLFFVISLFVMVAVAAISPKVFTKGSYRLVNYSTYFEPEAPFQFILLNKGLICERGKDYTLELKISGEYIPENVYIKIGENNFLMSKGKDITKFSFIIRNINNDLEFQLKADNFFSQLYQINVLPAPILKSFSIDIVSPPYTGIEAKRVLNSGDILVPFGSIVSWNFNTSNVNIINFIYGSDTAIIKNVGTNNTYKRMIRSSSSYSMVFRNDNFSTNNLLQYNINVIPDLFPEIELKMVEDSLKVGAYYFLLNLKDDYGFHDLFFVKKVVDEDSTKNISTQELQFNKSIKNQEVFYYFDFNTIDNLSENSLVEYYFEIRDNDYISGFKKTRTLSKIFKPFNREQIRNEVDKLEESSEQALSKSKKLTEDIQKEIEEFKKKEMNNELNDWEKQNYLKNILEKQKNLEKFVEDVKEQYQKKSVVDNQFYQDQKAAIEKQKQVQELLDQIMDDELKKLMEEIKKLSEKFSDKDFQNMKDKIDFSYKNMEKKLDRTLELLKRFQIEDNISHLAEDIDKLSEKQELLSEDKTSKKEVSDKLDKQNKLNDEFKELKNDFKETQEKNKELKSPYKFENFDQSFNKIDQKMDDLKKDIPSNSNKKTKEQQKEISKEMKDMSQAMENMFKEMNMNALNLNIADLRQLIDNISTFSFNQEDVLDLLNKNLTSSPSYPEIISKQNKIKNDFQMINDSLTALSSRVPLMSQMITKESDNIKFNLEKATNEIEERHRREGLNMQRLIMNSANTLDLLLDELMKQMQNQQSSGSGSEKKDGQPQMMQNLKKQQEKLKEQLQGLLDEMKKNEGKPNGPGMNDQLVKTLAEQEIFNKMLQDLQQGKGINPETDQKLKEIKQLSDKNIDDLINKNISPELFNRNQKILTRLLEAEKSENEREQEKKRESKEGKKEDLIIPDELKEMLKKDTKYKEALKKNNLNLKNYYQNLSDEYFRIINN